MPMAVVILRKPVRKGEMRYVYESCPGACVRDRIIPVIAFNSVDEALPLCKALSDGGLPAAEVTFRTACAEECIRLIHKEMPDMLLGAGHRPDQGPGRPCHRCGRFLHRGPRL